MSQPLILSAVSGGVARITLNRPAKRNALTQSMLRELNARLDELSARDDIRLVRLEAAGLVFCAGMDLTEMQQRAGLENAAELWREDTELYAAAVTKLLTWPAPTIAVLSGPVLAGGVGLALACDFLIAVESAWMELPEPRRGISAAVVTPLLIYRLGVSQAMPLLLGGRRIAAPEAHAAGWCHALSRLDNLTEVVEDWCSHILTGGPQALARTKRLLLETAGADLLRQLELGRDVSAAARATDEAREGLAAFLEKRNPRWFPQ